AGVEPPLLNLFDFSGEMTQRRLDASPLRKRALQMDGVIIVLDPTWPRDKDPGRRIVEWQKDAFQRFVNELRRVRGQAAGSLNVPVAVCLTKLDLLPTQSLLDTDSLRWLDQLRATDREKADLATLHQRSDLVRKVLDRLFPGWGITRALQTNFGNSFLFFPLTPVGLDDNETLLRLLPGVKSLEGRQMISFGVV